VTVRCPVCTQPEGRHWTIPHVWMPKAEQERRIREADAIEWLKRRLAEFKEQAQ
jgi:hypothetical protein